MTEVAVALAVGCVLQIAETSFAPAPSGWTETTRLEVVADPSCPWIDLTLPPGGRLGDHRARQRLADGAHAKLGEERWESSPRARDGSGVVRLHVPELLSGDRVLIDLERLLPPGPVSWRPGPARFVEAEVGRDGAITQPAGAEGRTWMASAPADFRVVFDGTGPAPVAQDRLAPGDVTVEQRLTLKVPPGDPQLALYPGGGSSVVIEEFLRFGPAGQERAWPLDTPPGIAVALSAEPAGAASIERDPAGARVVVAASEGPIRATVRWEQPDAPSYGERPYDVSTLAVDAPGGEIRHEGDGWWLVGVNERAVMPNREVLVGALDRRFRMAAIPEPGAPLELRGADPGWELAAEIRPVLLGRYVVGDWPADPLWPRKLVRARRSTALTPTETALTAWLYARQLGLDASWVLVRPATSGPGYDVVPSGYTAALVRIRIGDETRWIDPTCRVCGPFELPPDLEGASALGVGIDRTPPPTVGRHAVEVGAGTVSWTLQGPPALELRRWLETVPAAERTSALSTRIGGPGSTLVEVHGIEVAGDPIAITVNRGEGVVPSPLDTPVADPSGTVWFGWIGDRTIRWPDSEAPEGTASSGPLAWSRVRTAEGVVETLSVTDRTVAAADVARIEEARRGLPAE